MRIVAATALKGNVRCQRLSAGILILGQFQKASLNLSSRNISAVWTRLYFPLLKKCRLWF